MSSGFLAGTVIEVSSSTEKNGEFHVKQVHEENLLPLPVRGRVEARKDFNWDFGPVKLAGYIDVETFEIGISLLVFGISLGSYYGNLKQGVGINVNLFLVKGSIRFYLKDENELWVHLDLKVEFDGSFEGDYKILSW